MPTTTLTVLPNPNIGSADEIAEANKAIDPLRYDDPYGVQAANSGITQPITPQAPVGETSSPTVISTDSMREQLAGAEKSLLDLKAQIEAGSIPQKEEAKTETKKTDTPSLMGETKEKDPYLTEIENYTKTTNKILTDRKNEFNRYLTRSSQLLKSQIRSIQKTFDVRRSQAEDVANRAMAATTTLGARTGRMRYAPELQRGIITGQENDLISTLAEIDSFEQTAIAAAEEAAYNRDYTTFLDQIENIDALQKNRETKLEELNKVMEEENKRRETEIETAKQEEAIINTISLGTTDPIEIFQSLKGEIPYDVIKSYTDTLPKPESTEPIKLGSTDLLVDPITGNVIARGSKAGGGGSSVGNAVGYGNSVVTVGSPSIPGLGTTYENSSMEAQLMIDDIVNGLPTQLINNVAEIPRWREAVRKQLNAGYTAQQVIDKLSGFRLFEGADKNLGATFYNLMTGTDLEPQALSSLINRGAVEQAMTTVENAQLKNTDLFFGSLDDSKAFVGAADRALALINDPNFPTDFLGQFDGRVFKTERWLGKDATEAERKLLQQLETQLAMLNAPTRVSIAGTAATPEEMEKINSFQADIFDNPGTMKEKLATLQQEILGFHNAARSTRGLPTVDKSQLLSNTERLKLYRSLGAQEQEAATSSLSNSSLLFGEDESEGDAWAITGI